VNHCKQSITNQEPPAYECVCVSECNDVFFQNFCTKQMFFSETSQGSHPTDWGPVAEELGEDLKNVKHINC